jgi:hypothetical protein
MNGSLHYGKQVCSFRSLLLVCLTAPLWLLTDKLLAQAPENALAAYQRAQDEAVVRRFFPKHMLDDDAKDIASRGGPSLLESAFLRADLEKTGRLDYLVTVYAGPASASIRVLKGKGETSALVNEPALCPFAGRSPELSLIDLDHSGVPQILATVTTNRGEERSMTLKWSGRELVPFGAYKQDRGCQHSLALNAEYVDLDGDGILEIVSRPKPSTPDIESLAPDRDEVFKLVDGRYSPVGSFEYFSSFFPAAPISADRNDAFGAGDPAAAHILVVANGNGRDEEPVSAAEITLNGELILPLGRINTGVRSLAIPIKVQAKNTIEVKVQGSKKATLFVGVSAAEASPLRAK